MLKANSMYLIERGRKPRAICRLCSKLHGAKDCPKALRLPVLTMREWRMRKKLEAQYGRQLTWDEVLVLSGTCPKFVQVVNA